MLIETDSIQFANNYISENKPKKEDKKGVN